MNETDRQPRCLIGRDLGLAWDGRWVLRDVTVRVVPGRASVVVGPSGSGKTTLLWILSGLRAPTTGRCLLATGGAADASGRAAGASARGSIGMVFQRPVLWGHLRVERHLRLVLSGRAGRGLPRRARRERIERVLSQMRLGPLRRRRPGALSGGEQQRLAIARALVVEPRWLFLDEPLAHLDGPTREEVFALLRDALADRLGPRGGAGCGVLMATHNPCEAMRLADEILILLAGRLVQAGPPDEVYRNPVSLAAARALGPASEVRGEAIGGVLSCEGVGVVAGVEASASGPVSLILRPEDVEFAAAPDGAAVVRRSEFAAGAYHLFVTVAGQDLVVLHPAPSRRAR